MVEQRRTERGERMPHPSFAAVRFVVRPCWKSHLLFNHSLTANVNDEKNVLKDSTKTEGG
jgi:hypothetical protein